MEIILYPDGWWITFVALDGVRRKTSGPYKKKSFAKLDEEVNAVKKKRKMV